MYNRGIKYYSSDDLSCGYYLEKASQVLEEFNEAEEYSDINQIIEFYNIHCYLQREIRKQIADVGLGTKSQQALNLQHEQGKQERKDCFHKRQEAEKQFQFELKQQKRKEKHKGR